MNDPNRMVKLGDRVYYIQTGKHDTGTIVNITLEEYPFTVKWDKSVNVDETLDQFMGSQLGFVAEELRDDSMVDSNE